MTAGGAGDDQAHSMVQSNDGGYVIAGQTNSFGAGGWDVYVAKFSSSGTLVWTRTIGGSGTDYGRSLVKTYDGGYAIAGSTTSFGAGSEDVYLIKLDGSGNLLWTKTYGGTGSDIGWEIVQTGDSGLAIAGQTSSFASSPTDMYVIRTDRNGARIWEKAVGQSGVADLAYSLVHTTDGGFAICGTAYTWTGNGSTSSNDFYIVKLDGLGNLMWSRLVQDNNTTRLADYARSIIQTTDGGYMISGEAGQPSVGGGFNWHYLLVKLDALGAVTWTRYYGGTQISGVSAENSDYAESVLQTPDGGYLVAGWSFSFNYNFGIGQQVGLEFYLIKVNASGTLLSTVILGSAINDIGKSIIRTSDGGFAIAGYSQPVSPGSVLDEILIIKLDSTLGTCCTSRSAGADRGSGPTNTTRGSSVAVNGTIGTGGTGTTGGTSNVNCASQTPLNASFQSSDSTICESNNCISFTDFSTGNPSAWAWSFPGATPSVSSTQNPTNICYPSPGTYSVTLIVSNGIQSDTLIVPNLITVVGSPVTPTITPSGPVTFCAGDSVTLTSSSTSGNLWSPGGETTQSITVDTSGTYFVNVSNGVGCISSSGNIVVLVVPLPNTPVIGPPGPLKLCPLDTLLLNSSSPTNNLWSPGGQTSQSIQIFSPGNYSVVVIQNGCTSLVSNSVSVTAVSNPPQPTITQGTNDTLFCTPAATYQWYLNGVLIPGAIDSFYVAAQPGIYSVFITNSEGCGVFSQSLIVSSEHSIEKTTFHLYPNPGSNQLFVQWNNRSPFQLSVKDIQGREIFSSEGESNQISIQTANFAEGWYLVSLILDNTISHYSSWIKTNH